MCGIVGFVGKGSENDLESMRQAIQHRGPDDHGLYYQEGLGLAHNRLSILDISERGRQPMWSKDRAIAIVFNGEIYNFQELKEALISKNLYEFKTSTDTEVIINLYLEYGEDCFSKLNGMFAIAIYDFRSNKLLLARDRLGKKPLYWGVFDGTLIFGSELKAILKHPSFKKEINLRALNKYLAYEYVPTPYSIFEGVYKLEPATCLTFCNNNVKQAMFWQMDFASRDLSLADSLKILDRELDESVKRRLVSDVPLGIFLSGGLDSSAVIYYAQKNSAQKIKTFSIGFEEKSFDESDYARRVSDILGTEHHTQVLSSGEALKIVPHLGEILDEPLADASMIPTLFLSEFAKKHVTVVLGGDGGDELFAGYPTFQAERVAPLYEKTPRLIKDLIKKLISNIPASDVNFSARFKAEKFVDGFEVEQKYRHQRWLGSFSHEQRAKLFKSEVWAKIETENEYEEIDNYLSGLTITDWRNRLIYLYLRTYLMDGVLVKVDRASMFHALEVRAPFLDFTLVDFINSLPYEYKNKGFTTKYILKKLMADKLPRDIVYRKKKGFGVPITRWLRGELKDFCNEVLSEKVVAETGLFDFDYIQRLKQEHFTGQEDHRKLLWTLLMFQLWYNRWMR